MNIKVPVSWLREYLKTDLAAKTLANYLSLSGPSVERIEKKKEDFIFEVEVTSNRPDSASVFGLAREANAILHFRGEKSALAAPKGQDLVLEPDTSSTLTLDVVIKNKNLCPRFTAIVVDNVKIKPSPAQVKNRLQACGIRPINNIVDISNYLMLELGQPMHTFDFDKIRKSKMILRESQEGEKIVTLDGQSRILPAGSIVIEDDRRLIDLCGIMGGANSEITRRTYRVVFFVQAYDPVRIRKTTQALSLRTEAAGRFEKGVDLEAIPQALSRAVYLAKLTAGAKVASELIDIYPNKVKPVQIYLDLQKLTSYLSVEINAQTAVKILENLGFRAKVESSKIVATPPSWRTNDVEQDVDLIEEIARIYGYHNLPSRLPSGQVPNIAGDELHETIELKKALKYLGLTEVATYSIISKEFLKLTQIKEKDAVELENPLTEEWQFMRPTLVVSLASIVAQNQNLRQNLKIFEIAKTYISSRHSERSEESLPTQDLHIAFALQNSNFLEIKGLIENLFEILKREPKFQKFSGPNPLSENSSFALIKSGDQTLGGMGILRREVADYFGIEGDTYVAEINLYVAYEQPTSDLTYKPIPKYPPVIEDISAIFAKTAEIGEIIQEVKKTGSPLVKNIEVIDVFSSEKIGENKKSVTLRLTYQRTDQTPTHEEVTETRNKISLSLTKSFFAQIRK